MSDESTPRSGGYLGREPSTDPLVIKTARSVRRVGFIIMGVVCLWTTIPVFIGVIGGLMDGDVRDPISQRTVDQDSEADDCHVWGLDLMASGNDAVPAQVEDWARHCGTHHPLIRARLTKLNNKN